MAINQSIGDSKKNILYSSLNQNQDMGIFSFEKVSIESNSTDRDLIKVYDDNDQSENALVILSKIYNHANLRVTRDYLDITQDILDDVYLGM